MIGEVLDAPGDYGRPSGGQAEDHRMSETNFEKRLVAETPDAADRQGIEEALRKQAQILDLASDTICIRDLEDRITYWNQGAERLYGWTRAAALGKSSHTLLRTEFPIPLDEINRCLAESGHWEGELVQTKRDGTRISVESRWTFYRDESNTLSAVLEIGHDITERKRFEESLRKANQMKSEFLANYVA
jgi:PAS domain S-box-containing protein